MKLPKSIIFDLDDTLLLYNGTIERDWRAVCDQYALQHNSVSAETLFQKIREEGVWFWSDATRHRLGRNDMEGTRRNIVAGALKKLGIEKPGLAESLAADYSKRRYQGLELFPGVYDTLTWIRQQGITLGMLTNGESKMQRAKIDRFDLAPFFDVIQVEGEAGVGKPEIQAYDIILKALDSQVDETWIVGDNIEWEVKIPQSLGIFSIWINFYHKELKDKTIVPDRTIHQVPEVRHILEKIESNQT